MFPSFSLLILIGFPVVLEEYPLSRCFIGAIACLLCFFDEFTDVAELAIDAGKAYVCNLVHFFQQFADGITDERGGYLLIVITEDAFFGLFDDFKQLVIADGSFIACSLQAGQDAPSIIWNSRTIFFYHGEAGGLLDAFVRGESPVARKALSSSPDGASAIGTS